MFFIRIQRNLIQVKRCQLQAWQASFGLSFYGDDCFGFQISPRNSSGNGVGRLLQNGTIVCRCGP